MAGGKETPRQKMIGMMYLVLTALLALNVSKSILDAFVTFDKNINDASLSVEGQGMEAFSGINDLANSTEEPERAKAAKKWLPMAQAIQESTQERIDDLNRIREVLLKATGEDIATIKKENEISGKIEWDLEKVNAKDNYDVPMQVMVGDDIKKPNPNKEGMKLWENMLQYRNDITKTLATYQNFSFDAENYTPGDESGLASVSGEDQAVIRQLYNQLTKKEKADVHNGEIKDVHWVGRTFDHAPIVAAMATLSSIEQELRTAEAVALRHIRAKIGSSDYSFNKIVPLAFAPSNYYNQGDSMEIKVMMAAYDSYNSPSVTFKSDSTATEESSPVKVVDGMGIVKLKADSPGQQWLGGTIMIKKKDGTPVPQKWSFPYTVGKPSGTVSLPELNVLYRGYANKVEGAASGYASYDLRGSGVTLKRSGQQYIASPGSGRECTISIVGKNPDGSSANLGSYKFRVSNLPAPTIKFGSLWDGDEAGSATMKSNTTLFAKYPPEIPLEAKFSVKSWEVSVSGAPRPESGSGSRLTPKAMSLIKQAKKGSLISFMTRVTGPDGKTRKKGATFKIK